MNVYTVIKDKWSRIWIVRCLGLIVSAAAVMPAPLLQAQNAAPAPQPRVINGSNAPEGAYPFMAALLWTGEEKPAFNHRCGATLIAPQYAITAAHCVMNPWTGALLPTKWLELQFSNGKLSQTGAIRVGINGITVFPKFTLWTMEGDAALLKLSAPVNLPTVKLASASDLQAIKAGDSLTLIGWGMTDPTLPILPDVLQQAVLPLVSDEECTKANGRLYQPDHMVCAGKLESSPGAGDGLDSCFGDSGGPLLLKRGDEWLQVGIVSFGLSQECAAHKTYGIYTRVSAISDWAYSFPAITPIGRVPPSITSNAFEVGQVLHASTGVWGGDPATSITYQWYRMSALEAIEASSSAYYIPPTKIDNATSADYLTSASDEGYIFQVVTTASNSGGSEKQYSWFTQLISAAGTYGQPTPEPTPQVDTEAPEVLAFARKCTQKKCHIYVMAKDSDYSSGIQKVEAKMVLTQKIKGKKGSSRSIVLRDVVSANQVDGKIWEFALLRNRSAQYRLDIRARDFAGHISKRALRVKFRG